VLYAYNVFINSMLDIIIKVFSNFIKIPYSIFSVVQLRQ